MRTTLAQVVTGIAALWCAAAAAQTSPSAQTWLGRVPPLPATAAAAYAQWTDTGGVLKPGPGFEKVREGLRIQIQQLSRPVQTPADSGRPLSRKDQAQADRISVFPDTARVLQNVQAARTARAALLQKWQAELNALEQSRLRERSALPACHNEAGTPSQAAIRDVELAYVSRRAEIAAQYLERFQPVLQQLVAAVSPRISHGDADMDAWNRLADPGARARLAPVAHSAQSEALLDVGLVSDFVQEVSKWAARPVADRNALGRVYADAKGC